MTDHTIGIDISKDGLDAYRLIDGQHRRFSNNKAGFKRAAVAVARKLAVIMHAMFQTGELFEPSINAEA